MFASNPEFRYLRANYNFYRITAIEIAVRPMMPYTQQYIKSLPSVFVKIVAGVNNMSNIADGVATYYADDAVECAPTQTEGAVARYEIPGIMIGTSGYAWAGQQAWISTYSAAQNPGVYLCFGAPANQFVCSAPADFTCPVYSVDVRFITDFATPILDTASV